MPGLPHPFKTATRTGGRTPGAETDGADTDDFGFRSEGTEYSFSRLEMAVNPEAISTISESMVITANFFGIGCSPLFPLITEYGRKRFIRSFRASQSPFSFDDNKKKGHIDSLWIPGDILSEKLHRVFVE
jgi:hypothetical protein